MGTTTYSFKDTVGAIVSPLAGPYILAGGKVGAGQFVVSNTTMHGSQETASDGAVVQIYESGDSGGFVIECQQTSAMHKYLLRGFNLHKTAADAGDISNWGAITVQLRNILDGSQHLITGVQYTKIPDKAYGGKPGMLRWELLAANSISL